MADLLGTTGGSGGPSQVPVTNGAAATATARPTAGVSSPAAQTGSPSQGIRGPRMIMRERAEREARQRAEREQMERKRAEEEARQLEEQRRRAAERARPAAGVAAAGAVGGGSIDTSVDPATQRRQQRAAQEAQTGAGGTAGPSRTQQPSTHAQPLRPTRVPGVSTSQGPTAAAGATIPPGAAQTQETTDAPGVAVTATRPRNSFPHAFERWEALSAHWEGMTSYWIRKLQENTEDLDRNPISAQLSRQVSDLSAAGANLFHAVVELQRLRASSERKFQRWFFETRAELERHQEVNAQLQSLLDEERRGRADAIREAVEHERVHSKTQKLLAEMRKELMISKEEARRAWEELGRREQEERDRTLSLQQGLPTIVGGVQVVPMTQGVPSRQTSTRDHPPSQSHPGESEYMQAQAGQPQYSHDSPVQATSSSAPGASGTGYYHQQAPTAAGQEQTGYGAATSEAGYSEEDYESPTSPKPSSYPPSSSHWAPEYAGEGYAAPGWETMPRHHHPTRLSDVIEEEDERSRTSASQVSRA
ncbi:hypothetical protein VTK73DRAFT_5353 [Phialemonium thermophilum]|uniref:Uncharacterized protein n=1 Tax=Phialemonium thermophilum TaxID=223376 RepID=A0ABR3Y8X0_9PEZI